MNPHRSQRVACTAFGVALALAGAGLAGCSGEKDGRATAPELEAQVPDIRGPDDLTDVYTGFLDARFVEDLPAYEGQEVTVLAAVAEVFSPRTFSVTSPDEAEIDPVLVVTTTAAAEELPRPGEEVVVAATPFADFDAESVVREAGLGIGAAALQDWDDETYLLATIVEPAP